MKSDKMRQFKKKAIFLLAFHLRVDQNIIFSQQDADYVAGDRARAFMSPITTRAPSLINYFIFVHYHKQIIIPVYEHRNVH